MKTLSQLIKQANFNCVNENINESNFPQQEIRKGDFKVMPFLDNETPLDDETPQEVGKRLTEQGFVLANIYELAQFVIDYPKELEKWYDVLAIDQTSHWTVPDGRVFVPDAYVRGAYRHFALRHFALRDFRGQLDSRYGVLVLGESDTIKTCACGKEISKEKQQQIDDEWENADICKSCGYEQRNGHSYQCEKNIDRYNQGFDAGVKIERERWSTQTANENYEEVRRLERERILERIKREAWHEISCPAYLNKMEEKTRCNCVSICDCVYGFVIYLLTHKP